MVCHCLLRLEAEMSLGESRTIPRCDGKTGFSRGEIHSNRQRLIKKGVTGKKALPLAVRRWEPHIGVRFGIITIPRMVVNDFREILSQRT
jgi:hypothetical protein